MRIVTEIYGLIMLIDWLNYILIQMLKKLILLELENELSKEQFKILKLLYRDLFGIISLSLKDKTFTLFFLGHK